MCGTVEVDNVCDKIISGTILIQIAADATVREASYYSYHIYDMQYILRETCLRAHILFV